ncbi:MAG: diadenylate cyclase CdaA [Bacteroidales bacterium]|nr:diadenylate cyclase CdaA [Bacteroidales bacterium]MBN2633905.1 diadenylate cyclase CdaA [Bacteroidales bacterium]
MIVPITVLDIIDILLVAFIFYQLYRIIKGTAALSIFIAIFLIYLFWLLVKALNMELVSSIIGQVTGVGVIALIVVFQQEVRRFLLMLGNRYMRNTRFTLKRFFSNLDENILAPVLVEELVAAAVSMSEKKSGALIVIGRQTRLAAYTEEGQIIKAQISAELLETLFFKNSPLHDGAVLIEDGLILAARCPLPVTDQFKLPPNLGMRHRAAIGMSEHTDAIVVVVSEETGRISYSESGILREGLKPNELRNLLLAEKVW